MPNEGQAQDSPKSSDIEHAIVQDDPRLWSHSRKNITLFIIASSALITPLAANIYNPALQQVQDDLHTNNAKISLSISIFVIAQGTAPLVWSAISEVKGRKIVYLASISLFTAASAVVGAAKTIDLLIGMRALQAAGNAAVSTIGAGTLADIFDTHERGTMMGIYYAAPLLGPSLGPIIGGILTQVWSWRATFYFLSAFGGVLLVSFVFFKDTFRRERSLTYQTILKRLQKRQEQKASQNGNILVTGAIGLSPSTFEHEKDAASSIELSLSDVNPFPPLWNVLLRKNNLAIFVVGGLLNGFYYSIGYTCSLTLFAAPYNYTALKVGAVLLSTGLGSVLGGWWSDKVLSRAAAANGGVNVPEMRLVATKLCMPLLPLSVLAYAWMAQEHVHIAGLVSALFLSGFSSIWIYSSTLSYVVDSNAGRSSTAVAGNSLFRGIAAFIFTEAAVPLQVTLGDGGLYTLWAGLCVVLDLIILCVIWRGDRWRRQAEEKEKARSYL